MGPFQLHNKGTLEINEGSYSLYFLKTYHLFSKEEQYGRKFMRLGVRRTRVPILAPGTRFLTSLSFCFLISERWIIISVDKDIVKDQ